MTASICLTDSFEPRSRLELTDSELAELVRFAGQLNYRRSVSLDDVALHAYGVTARVESRWRQTRVRIFREPPKHAGLQLSIRMIVECEYRLGPRNASELRDTVCWAHGTSWIDEISSRRDVSFLRDLLANWPDKGTEAPSR